MIRLLSLAVSLLACAPGQAQSTVDEVHLRGTVQDVVMLTDFSGKVIQVDFDPRFALTVRIESVDRPSTVLLRALSLHSPSTARHFYLERMTRRLRLTTFLYAVRLSMASQGILA